MNRLSTSEVSAENATERVEIFDWQRVSRDLDAQGNAVLEGILSQDECGALAALYPEDDHFRSRVVMGRHGFGRSHRRGPHRLCVCALR